MKSVSLMAATLGLVLAAPAAAQTSRSEEVPRAEVFGGYSFLRANLSDQSPVGTTGYFPTAELNTHGWNASVAGLNLTPWLGFKADFSGYSSTTEVSAFGSFDERIHTFLFGPQITSRGRRVNQFAHALFGAARGATEPGGFGAGTYATSFAMAFGGGVDWKVGNAFALRLAQADYLMTRFGVDTPQHNLRLSAGIVFRWNR